MKERHFIEVDGQEIDLPFPPNRLIFLTKIGSIAHGTHVPPSEDFGTDDLDIMGIFLPDQQHTIGLGKPWEGASGYSGHVDYTFYSLKKLITLLLKGNPNVLGLLWMPEVHVLKSTPTWQRLADNRHWFVSRHIYQAFIGYAWSQFGRMTGESSYQGYMGERRKKLVDEFGYDPKMAAHLIRLLRMGIEFLLNKFLLVDRTGRDAEELLQIKRGEWPLERVVSLANTLFRLAEKTYHECDLHDREPERDQAERYLILETLRSYHLTEAT